MIVRREFITLLGGAAAAWPLAARAQQLDIRRVGVLMGIESNPDARARIAVSRQVLREQGWSEDRNIRIDVIWGEGDTDHVRVDAADLIRKSPDVILAVGAVPATELFKATRAIPIATNPRSTGSGTCTNTLCHEVLTDLLQTRLFCRLFDTSSPT